MKSRKVRRIGISAVVALAISGLISPSFAATLQGFICDQRGAVNIQNGTSHDKKFLIPGINKIAALTDAQASGPVGINYVFDPPIPFRFIDWYYKQANGSDALRGITARYCVSLPDGSDLTSFDIRGGASDRGGPVGDGWSKVIQDTRVFPGVVLGGNAVIRKLTFIFKDKNNQGNITLGRVEINQAGVSPILNTATGPCSLKEKCTNEI
jgi:hypothetical protein